MLICLQKPSRRRKGALSRLTECKVSGASTSLAFQYLPRQSVILVKMKLSALYNGTTLVMGTLALLLLTAAAAPAVESEDEQSENSLVGRPDEGDFGGPWEAINTAALRKLLLQLDAEDRLGRVSRSWPQPEPRGWGLRALDGRLARPWRADKRQVRFRQCYFNPISCFRK